MEFPKIINGNGFNQMLAAQKELLKHFKIIQGLPEYENSTIDDRKIQQTIKDFTYCFLEELGEASTEMEEAFNAMSINDLPTAQEKVINFNVEIADTTHFLMDILIYSGCEVDLCFVILERLLEEKNLDSLIDQEDLLTTLFNIGFFLNSKISKPKEFTKFTIFDRAEAVEVNKAGNRRISADCIHLQNEFCWEIGKHVLKAMNRLKNRSWHQTDKQINSIEYYDLLVNSLIVIFQYFDLVGLTPLTLFNNYFSKNQIVLERIKNKY